MGVYYNNQITGNLEKISGLGTVEYGASTVRKGTVGVPAIAANADYADQTITFSTPMPDTDYLVDLSLQGSNTHRVAFHVVANTKTVNGFTVRFTPIGIKQTTEVGVSGVANNLSYMLTVQRDDTYPNLTKNTALIDPAVSLPTEWNPMQTGYLKNPMPANEATLVYTAFKLYTDTEYNNLLNNAVLTSDVTDSVTNGDMNPVTSNAVYDNLKGLITYEDSNFSVNAETLEHYFLIKSPPTKTGYTAIAATATSVAGSTDTSAIIVGADLNAVRIFNHANAQSISGTIRYTYIRTAFV